MQSDQTVNLLHIPSYSPPSQFPLDFGSSSRKILEGGTTFRWVHMHKFRSASNGYQVEGVLKMVGDNNEHAICTLLFSLLAKITTFQQQLAVLYNLIIAQKNGWPLLPLLCLFGLYLVLRSSQRKQFIWCQDLPTSQLGRSQRQGQVQPFACKLNTENMWRQDHPPFRIFLVPGSSSLHVIRTRSAEIKGFF